MTPTVSGKPLGMPEDPLPPDPRNPLPPASVGTKRILYFKKNASIIAFWTSFSKGGFGLATRGLAVLTNLHPLPNDDMAKSAVTRKFARDLVHPNLGIVSTARAQGSVWAPVFLMMAATADLTLHLDSLRLKVREGALLGE